jgi:hypothetical protein
MKKLLPAIVLAVQATLAYGHDINDIDVNNTSRSVSDADANANSKSVSDADASSKSTSSAKSGDSTSGASASSGGNSVSNSSVYKEVQQAVDGYSSGTNTTSGCRYDSHMGLGSVLGGISFGRGFKDKGCVQLKLANEFWSKGMNIAAERIYCSIKEVKEALGEDCIALLNEQHAITPPAAVSDAVTHDELNNAMKKALSK